MVATIINWWTKIIICYVVATIINWWTENNKFIYGCSQFSFLIFFLSLFSQIFICIEVFYLSATVHTFQSNFTKHFQAGPSRKAIQATIYQEVYILQTISKLQFIKKYGGILQNARHQTLNLLKHFYINISVAIFMQNDMYRKKCVETLLWKHCNITMA